MRKIKRFFIIALTLLLVTMLLPLGSFKAQAEEGDGEPEVLGKTYKVGEIIKFGHYEQDGNTANGKEEIEWQVLKVEYDKMLVVSKYALDCKKYNETRTDVTWETCSLRNWLNNDFKNEAFTSEEQSKIPTVTIVNKNNPGFGTEGGNDTYDQIFCLSFEEMRSYFGQYTWWYDNENGCNQNLICTPTKYAENNGAYGYTITKSYYDTELSGKGYTSDVIGRRGAWWWLRTPGDSNNTACRVYFLGMSGTSYYYYVNAEEHAVRPALYINIYHQDNFFADIQSGTWQYKAAMMIYDKGYMTGTGTKDGKIVFSPNTDMNRTMFVQALYSMDGKPDVSYVQKFGDVKESAWYAKSVTWASNSGVVAGNPDGTFGINGKATREQMALMLYQYAKYKKYDVSVSTSTNLNGFTDSKKVSNWAYEAVKWAVERGIISGKGNAQSGYRIAPTEKATRIECAAMINKFSEVYASTPKLGDEDLEEPLALPMEEIEDIPVPEEEAEDIIEDEDAVPVDKEDEDTVDDEDAVPEDKEDTIDDEDAVPEEESEDNIDREDVIPKEEI